MPYPDEFQYTGNAGLGWACGTSRTGSLHRARNHPCEDAFALWSGSAGAVPCIAIAVADGHGDPRHDRSRTGSALAVQEAVDELVTFHRTHPADLPQHVLRAEFRADFPRRICRRWRDAVLAEAGLGSTTAPPEEPEGELFSRYGTTLIAAAVMHDSILAGQIGDGDLLLIRPDGTIEYPVPAETGLVGNETRSLSSRDSHLLWRVATLDRDGGGILMAATDGISDSFDGSGGPEFERFVRSLAERIGAYGVAGVAAAMGGWLDRYSATGSGDDMTLVFILIPPSVVPGETGLSCGDRTGSDEGGEV